MRQGKEEMGLNRLAVYFLCTILFIAELTQCILSTPRSGHYQYLHCADKGTEAKRSKSSLASSCSWVGFIINENLVDDSAHQRALIITYLNPFLTASIFLYLQE